MAHPRCIVCGTAMDYKTWAHWDPPTLKQMSRVTGRALRDGSPNMTYMCSGHAGFDAMGHGQDDFAFIDRSVFHSVCYASDDPMGSIWVNSFNGYYDYEESLPPGFSYERIPGSETPVTLYSANHNTPLVNAGTRALGLLSKHSILKWYKMSNKTWATIPLFEASVEVYVHHAGSNEVIMLVIDKLGRSLAHYVGTWDEFAARRKAWNSWSTGTTKTVADAVAKLGDDFDDASFRKAVAENTPSFPVYLCMVEELPVVHSYE